MALADKIARLKKAKETEERVKKGGPLKIKGKMSEVERLECAAAKANEEYIKEVMASRKDILKGMTDYQRVIDNAPVMDRAVNELRDFFRRDIHQELELLEIEKFKLIVMEELASSDIDNLIDAQEAQEAFNEALRVYTLGVLEAGVEVEEEEVKALWERIVGEKHNATLLRGTTIFFTLDMYFQQAIAAWKKGEVEDWREEIIARIRRVGEIFNIPEDTIMEIESY